MEKKVELSKQHTKARDITNAQVIKERDLTLLTLPDGSVPTIDNYGYGLYHRDCRFLSGYITKINGETPTSILSSDEKEYGSVVMLSNPEMACPDGSPIASNTISIRRDRSIAGEIQETVLVDNYNEFTMPLDLSFEFQADFADIFTIRGATPGTNGIYKPVRYERGALMMEYIGKDKHTVSRK